VIPGSRAGQETAAQALAERGDPGWEAVSDAALWLYNDIGRRGLPQRSRVREEIAEGRGRFDDDLSGGVRGRQPDTG
jgi:hypothetical protein